jgi:hypothetical protein
MKFFANSIYFIICIFFILNCESRKVRLHNPSNLENGNRQSIIAFGHYRLESGIFGKIGSTDSILTLVEVISVNDNNKSVITSPFIPEEPIKVEQGSDIVYFNNVIIENGYYTLLLLDTNKKYAIQKLDWYVNCGQGCQRSYSLNFDIYDSFKTLPIQSKPGEINFLGIKQIKIVDSNEENSNEKEKINNDSMSSFIKKITPQFNRKAVLSDGEPDIIKEELDNVKKLFYEENSYDKISAERNFLKKFIVRQKEGYWKDKAEIKLSQLLK